MRRLMSALAALAAVAVLVFAPGVPVFAAPKPLCTVEEFRNPLNFVDCANRLKEHAQATATCLNAPTPASPGTGLAGWVSSRPASANLPGTGDGRWSRYGVGGYRLDLYDVGCAGAVRNPQASAENMLGSWLFTAAAGVLGTANTLREYAYQPGSVWTWSDEWLADLTKSMYDNVFLTLGILALAGVGLWLLGRSRRGDMSGTLHATGWAIFVMLAVTAIAQYPLHATHAADSIASTGLRLMHSIVGPASATVPPEKCAALTPDACVDHRTAATRASDAVTDAVLYRAWLRAVLGDDDSNTAKMYGPALFDAATLTWEEVANISGQPELRQIIVQRKANQWIAVSDQIKREDPAAYEYLQGTRGTDRWTSGLIALFSALVFAVFDMMWSLIILLGFGIFRLAVVALPIVGTMGIILPWSNGLRRLANTVVAAILNIVLFGAAAGLFLSIVERIFASGLPGLAQVAAVLLSGVICWLLLSPVQRGMRSVGFRRLERPDSDGDGGRRWARGAASMLGRLAKDVVVRAASERTTAGGSSGPIRGEAWVGRPRPETRALTAGPKGGSR